MCKSMKLAQTKDGLILEVFVKPNSPAFKIIFEGDEMVIHCMQEPVKGKVNKEIIKEFSKLFHRKVELLSGATSRQKRLLIMGIKKSEAENLLTNKSHAT